jgi:hypothetical protein
MDCGVADLVGAVAFEIDHPPTLIDLVFSLTKIVSPSQFLFLELPRNYTDSYLIDNHSLKGSHG